MPLTMLNGCESLKAVSRDAREHLIAAKQRQKRYYDRRATSVQRWATWYGLATIA